MRYWELAVVTAAIGLGIYGAVARRGANIVHLDLRMLWMALIWGALQLGAAGIGFGGAQFLLNEDLRRGGSLWPRVLAVFLLITCGIRMILLGLHRKTLFEHRMEQIDMQQDVLLCLRCCGLAAAGGCVLGLLEYPFFALIPAAFCCSCLCTALGYLGGRAFGALRTDAAEIAGGILLCGLAAAMIV